MDPIKTIGRLLKGTEERDCIHIAILPVIAAEELFRGREVALVYGTTNQVKHVDSGYGMPTIGIVDPFFGLSAEGSEGSYRSRINKGERCWVFLYPGTVTGMRHAWTLPAIDQQKPPVNESEKWLREFADRWNFDYDEMIANAQVSDGYIVARGIDLHYASELEGDDLLFWEHVQKLTGKDFDDAHRKSFEWSCTC